MPAFNNKRSLASTHGTAEHPVCATVVGAAGNWPGGRSLTPLARPSSDSRRPVFLPPWAGIPIEPGGAAAKPGNLFGRAT